MKTFLLPVCRSRIFIFFTLLYFLQAGIANGQIYYNFQQTFGTWSALSQTGSTILLQNKDDNLSAKASIGFTFQLDGVDYTDFQASSNGWMMLLKSGDPAITDNAANSLPINNIDNPNFTPIIAPLWDDLKQNGVNPTFFIISRTTGTAPNRVLTIQWPNMRWNKSASAGVISFQVKLYETSNQVQFIYNNEPAAVVNGSASIGISGACPGDYYSLSTTGALNGLPAPFASKIKETDTLSVEPGGSNPQTYNFIPQTPVGGASNDLCSGAYPLSYNTVGNCQSTLATVVGSTGSGEPAAPGCWADQNVTNSVWFAVAKPGGKTTLKITTDLLENSPCNTAFNTDISVYSGTCGSLTEIGCANDAGGIGQYNPENGVLELTGLPSVNTIYYIRVEGNNMTPTTGKFLICATEAVPPGASCANPQVISGLPFAQSNLSTCGFNNDYTSSDACGSLYMDGEDFVFKYTPATTQAVDIALTGTLTWTGLFVVDGCPDAAGSTCVASVTNSAGNPQTQCGGVTLTAGHTYYIIVDTWPLPDCTPFNISVTPSNAGGPPNDQPCNAIPITLFGTAVNGTNACAGNAGEPTSPSCWTTGSANTVWYSVVAPASGTLAVQANAGSMEPQIAMYGGSGVTCTNLNVINQTSCAPFATSTGCGGFGFSYNAAFSIGGLTPGNTYYISVDGSYGEQGTFTLIINDSNSNLNPIPVQDCIAAFQVCSQTLSVPNPGYLGSGNICDYPNISNSCFPYGLQELNSAWYTFTCNPGTLEFDIISNIIFSDYDFQCWDLTAAGKTLADACTGISSYPGELIDPTMVTAGPFPTPDVYRCNWATNSSPYTGYTGLRVGNTNTTDYYMGGNQTHFNAPYVITGAPHTFLLYISNWSADNGFTLDFKSSPLAIGSSPTSLTWTGQVDNDWFKSGNWGGCYIPTCNVNVNIPGGSGNMPLINAAGAECQNITIQGGATLTINAGQQLQVCGNFFNYGTLSANMTSTVLITGAAGQSLSGSATGLSGSNKFGNLTVNKTSGILDVFQNVDVGGNFTLSAGTINPNNYTVKVAGDFTNSGDFGSVSSTETVEFNGNALQTYTKNGAGYGSFYNVTMNNGGAGLQLGNANLVVKNGGTATFTNGVIKTGPYEVQIFNRAASAAGSGNAISYVQGVMRRYINNSGAYDFAVGHPTKGYQRLNLNFSNAGGIDYMKVDFATHPTIPSALGVSGECGGANYLFPGLDNGYWQADAYNSGGTQLTGVGVYDATLYNRPGSFANSSGNFWTVMKDSGSGYNISTGTCMAGTINAVTRMGMTGFSKLATAQGDIPLPVSLLTFTATPEKKFITLDWQTTSETNNVGFEVQRSGDNQRFDKIGWVESQHKNASVTSAYQFNDKNARANTRYYYRLRQLDVDGNATFSPVVDALLPAVDLGLQASIYPNPTSGDLTLDILLEEKTPTNIRVFDDLGRLVFEQSANFTEGQSRLTLPTARLTPGSYRLLVQAGERLFTKSFVKSK